MPILDPIVGIKGAGEMASAVAWRLYMSNIRRVIMMETPRPLAVRREVSFCESLFLGKKTVEGVEAIMAESIHRVDEIWRQKAIPVIADPSWHSLVRLKPQVVVDAILAKRNLGTAINEAPLVIGLGPGFIAGVDVHLVIETNRGHHLGRIITRGSAEPNTGIPGDIGGHTSKRVLRAPADGTFQSEKEIGDLIRTGDIVGAVSGKTIKTAIDGIIRGLIRPGTTVTRNMKIGDIDPRGVKDFCYTISDKARTVSGSVLESILRVFNTSTPV